jgi:hypothetical protein
MRNIILSCINIWNDLDLFRVRNYFNTRMGVFPYHREDNRQMGDRIAEVSAQLQRGNQDERVLDIEQQSSTASIPET